jgi:hypothetical protein
MCLRIPFLIYFWSGRLHFVKKGQHHYNKHRHFTVQRYDVGYKSLAWRWLVLLVEMTIPLRRTSEAKLN